MSESSSSLREGLPRGFMDYMGVMHEEMCDEKLPAPLKRHADEDKIVNKKLQLRALLQEQFRMEAKKKIIIILSPKQF